MANYRRSIANARARKKLYNSKLWKDLRKRILHRDGYVCRECGDVLYLQVHHKKSFLEDWSVALDPNNLITLCRQCHTKATKRNGNPKYWMFPPQYKPTEEQLKWQRAIGALKDEKEQTCNL